MHYTQTYQLRARGFTLVEMLVVAALAAVVMGASMLYINEYLKEANRTKLVSEQAREMYMLSKATEEWMVQNSRNWALDTRITVTTDALITATFLPQDFARRIPLAGGAAITGVTPFGDRYNIAAIAALKDGKRVHRGVVWESGTPIGWGRYARAGLAQGSEPANGAGGASKINMIKNEIARALNTEWKHPAPGFANVPVATVHGVSGSWTQDVAGYLGVGVTFVTPSVVVLAGWPEYGSVLPPDTGTTDFGVCEVRAANCGGPPGSPLYLCTGSSTRYAGACGTGEVEVKRFPHCGGVSQVVSVPEIGSSLTYGRATTRVSAPESALSDADLQNCIAERPGIESWRLTCIAQYNDINTNQFDYTTDGTVSINNVIVAQYACSSHDYRYVAPVLGRLTWYGPAAQYGPQGANGADASTYQDVLCCDPE